MADIIMEHLPPEGWSELATKTDVATQGQLLRSEFEAQGRLFRRDLETQGRLFRRDLESQGLLLRSDLEAQGQLLRREFGEKMNGLRNELKADLAEGFAQQLKWLVGTMIALFTVTSGLVSVLVVVAK